MHHVHNPSAARLAFLAVNGLKPSNNKYGVINSTVSSLIKSFSFVEKLIIICKNLVSARIPPCTILYESFKNINVFLSLPTPNVVSCGSTLINGAIFNILTQSKINLMISDGLPSFFSSLRSFGLIEFTARSASSV